MCSRIIILVGFLLMVGTLLFLIMISSDAIADTIIVAKDGNGDYSSIQNAIDNATEGDIIKVWEGTYEENVVVNKTVSLIGNGSEVATIDGGGVRFHSTHSSIAPFEI